MSTLKVNAIQDINGVEVYTAKAWVNFNGTGTVAIRASGNVSSITDNGVGDYTVNFTSALVDANYAACLTSGSPTLGASNNALTYTAQTYSTASLRTQMVITTSAVAADVANANVSIFR